MYEIIRKIIFKFIPPESFSYKVIYFIYRKCSFIKNSIVVARDGILYRYFLKKFSLQLPEGVNITNNKYIVNSFPRLGDLEEIKIITTLLKYKPVISILMPVYNTSPAFLRMAIDSVLSQTYDQWELCIADDASTDAETLQVLKEYECKDERIKIIFKNKNEHICKTTQAALGLATGEFIGLLDHDDYLTPDALYQNVLVINKYPKTDMIYSDEAIADKFNRIRNFVFKSDWSPETFFSTMYTCHFTLFRTSLVKKVGGFRPGFDGSQDYDLTLRITEKTKEVYHIPKILYCWRFHFESVTMNAEGKPYAFEAGKAALNDALKRRKEPGFVDHDKKYFGKYQIHYAYQSMPSVDIMIHYTGNIAAISTYIKSILSATDYNKLSVKVFMPYTSDLIFARQQLNENGLSNIEINAASAASYNKVVSHSSSDYILFIDSSVIVVNSEASWLSRLVEQGMRKDIGAVTPLLVMPHRRVYSAGIVLDSKLLCMKKYGDGTVDPVTDLDTYDHLIITHNVAAVQFECFLVKRENFLSSGGFDKNYSHVTALSLDLSLRLLYKGMRNLSVPFVHMNIDIRNPIFSEREQLVDHKDAQLLKKKWSSYFEHDPYFSQNFNIIRNYAKK